MNNDIRNFNIPGFSEAESELLHKMLELIKIPITSEKNIKNAKTKMSTKSAFMRNVFSLNYPLQRHRNRRK